MTKKQRKNLIRISIALISFILCIIFNKFADFSLIIFNYNITNYIKISLFVGVYLFITYDILIKAIKNIFRGQIFDENFLMLIATIGAFVIKSYEEAVAVIIFYQIGEFFQSYAVGKSRKSISSLMDIRPEYANVVRNEEVIEVFPEDVLIDEIILVKPGEKIPLDGIVIEGNSTIDTRALTGESVPKEVCVNDEVISGTININKELYIRVRQTFYESTVSKILDLVENASSQKSKAENFITKFARYYTPIVVFLALLLALIPSIITGDWYDWVYRSLNFLVVSCPCALVISIPLSFFAGIGAASKYGILVKGSNYIEKFNKANIFVFDKTGTLTKGNFVVTGIYPIEKKDEIIKYAKTAECNSNHPIAKSINDLNGNGLTGYTIEEVLGQGIIARKEDDVIYCGNYKLLENAKIIFDSNNNVGTVLYVARNNEFLGSIVISDELKQESKKVISYLNSFGKTIMLTGDNEEVAKKVSNEIGVTHYNSELLPQEKVNIVEKMLSNKEEHEELCFIGDGINDAPTLMRADIGISMGAIGSDAAIEASDIVLMHDNLEGLNIMKKISQKTMRIVFQNIIFAIGIKVIVLFLSAFGLSNMWLGVFADVGVAVIAILNAMRVNSKYKI